jgi:di/tricarboxylate transporter
MTSDALFVFGVLGVTILLFVDGRLRLDLVALLALLSLLISGILTPAEGLAGFSEPAVVMIAALFVVGAAMLQSGLADRLGQAIAAVAGTGRARLTAALMLGTTSISAFVSTTGTVALMLPVAATLARNARISPSQLLMPMSVAALLGGLLTLIATPPNIIVSEQLATAGFEPFHFFSFTPIGAVMVAVGMLVLVPFGARLLPPRAPIDRPAGSDSVMRLSGEELARGYDIGRIARVRVAPGSPLIGNSASGIDLRREYGVDVLSVRRRVGLGRRRERLPHTADVIIEADDELELRGSSIAVDRIRAELLLILIGYRGEADAVLAEVLLMPRSRLIGQTLVSASFRTRYGVNVLSLRRGGHTAEGDIATVPLEFADTLLVAGSPARIEALRRESTDFVVIAQTADVGSGGPITRAEAMTLVILAGMVGMLAFNVLPPAVTVLAAAAALVLTRSIEIEAAYRSVDAKSVVLIAAMLPMATALQKTGGVDVIVRTLEPLLAVGPMVLLLGVFVLTGLLGSVISNTATAVLVAPIAMEAAARLGVSPYPVMMTVAIAASTAFATPVATPANLLVISPGEYTARDFARVGLIIQALALVATLLVVPLLFPL